MRNNDTWLKKFVQGQRKTNQDLRKFVEEQRKFNQYVEKRFRHHYRIFEKFVRQHDAWLKNHEIRLGKGGL